MHHLIEAPSPPQDVEVIVDKTIRVSHVSQGQAGHRSHPSHYLILDRRLRNSPHPVTELVKL